MAACPEEKPFADHATSQCVDACPEGSSANDEKDCVATEAAPAEAAPVN